MIRFLHPLGGNQIGDILDLGSVENSRLVGLGIATFDLNADRSLPSNGDMLFDSIDDVPAGTEGPIWINGTQYYATDVGFSKLALVNTTEDKMLRIAANDPAISSIYSSDKTATSNAIQQYESFASGSIGIVVENNSAVNVTIGYGSTVEKAIANVAANTINAGQTTSFIRKATDKYYAWASTGATVTIKISQGA